MELFKIFGSIIVDNKKALDSLSKTDKEAIRTTEAVNKIGEAGAKIGKAFAIGAAAVGTAMIGITKKTMDTLENIDKASQRAGMGAEEFQRWAHVAGLSGIEMTKLESAAIKNQRAMAQASQGAGKASESYKKLGIDIQGLTSDQVFEQVILNLSEMDDETQRNAIANDIFGKSFADLAPLLNESSDNIIAMKGELDELGVVMTEDQVKAGAALNDTIDRVSKLFGALVLQIGNQLIPHFQAIGDWILDHKEEIKEGFETVLNGIATAIEWVIENSDLLIAILAGVLGGFVALKIIGVITGLMKAYNTIQELAAIKGGVLNAVMAANPIGILVTLIGSLIAVGVLLWKNWDKVKSVADNLWQGIKNTFQKIGNFIGDTMQSAKDVVSGGVDKIKSFFSFNWAFPKLKMPHFKATGSMNPLKWVTEGVPKIGVEWYKKGGIMTKPTAFGMNGDKVMGGGEAGNEAILPLNEKNLSAIGRGIAETMNAPEINMERLTRAIVEGFMRVIPHMKIQIGNREIGKVYLGLRKEFG